MEKNKKWVKRGCLGTGCLLLAALLVLGPLMRSGDVSAIDSLPYVEKIKATQSTYTILEITPAAPAAGALTGHGSIGYYVKGSEPCKDWQSKLSAIQTAAARDAAAEALFSNLAGAGILSTGDGAPLKATFHDDTNGYYTEKYPWELTDFTGWTTLTLGREEAVEAAGSFSEKGSNTTGPFYSKVYDYTLLGTATGDSVQNIVYLTWYAAAPASEGDYCYYTPAADAWREIEWNDDGSLKTTGLDPAAAVYTENGGHYEKAGILGQTILSHDQTYYDLDLTKLGKPSAAWSAGCYAAARSAGFRLAADSEKGYAYFQSNGGTSYRLSDSGEYVFTADGSQSATIYTSKVWFKGGYTNNQWFLSKVFDVSSPSGSAIGIKVNSYAADRVTAAMVSAADMIVLSAGFDPARGSASYLPAAGGDFVNGSAAAQQIAMLAASGSTPIVVDWRLTQGSGSPNMRALAEGCLTGSPADADHNYVFGSIYCFTPTGAVQALATDRFAASFTSTATADGFSDALDEILNENFLRKRSGLGDSALLDQYISMAAAVRYVINHRGARVTGEISSVRVLELEPGTAKSAITEAQVYGWLGKPDTLKDYTTREDAIVITSMSTAEFVGRIENLVETYDLIYIGDSTIGLQTDSTTDETKYNDATNMNGLLYTNIGDTYKASYQLTGLLDRDYSSSSSDGYREIDASSSTKATTFRFSGNDLTASKAQELREFAEGGYPIVLGDKLMSSQSNSANFSFDISIVNTVSGNNVTLTAIPITTGSQLPEDVSFSYEWYRSDYLYSGYSPISQSASLPIDTAQYDDYYYYCVATPSGGDLSSVYAARSATYRVYRDSFSFAAAVDNSSAQSGHYLGSRDATATIRAVNPTGDASKNGNGYSIPLSVAQPSVSGLPADASITYSYQWQWSDDEDEGYRNIGSASSSGNYTDSYSVLNRGDSSYYRCQITLTIRSAQISNNPWTETITSGVRSVYKRNNNNYLTNIFSDGVGKDVTYYLKNVPTVSFSASVSYDYASQSEIALVTSVSGIASDTYRTYTWYKVGQSSPIATYSGYYSPDYHTVYSAGSYYCVVTVENGTRAARTGTIVVTAGGYQGVAVYYSGYYASAGSFTHTTYTGTAGINTLRVDRASNLYNALSATVGNPNVMAVTKVTPGKTDYAVNSGTLYQYLNLSKPKLDWVATTDENCRDGYPTAYALTDTGTITSLAPLADGSYSLTYSFQITNATDPTPQTTTYDCRFFIDLNADGLYKSDERLGGVEITLADTGKIVQPSGGVYALKPGTVYKLTRPLPEDKVGLIAWKLEVAQNGDNAYSHASQHGYTHIAATTKTPIRILQILHNNGGGLNLNTNETYKNWLAKVPDFDITIETINATSLDNNKYWVVNGAYVGRAEYFAQYDMLILGFADMYREISVDAAKDIVAYSKNHAVLFTHDTTSFCNVPYKNLKRTDGYNVYGDYWGYAFNSVLRSAVGLDRYGVTDATWGRTTMYDGTKNNHPVSSGPVSLTAKDSAGALISDQIRKAGYTLAYTPKKTAVADLSGYALSTVAETQGYTSHTLLRYKGSNTVTPSTYNDRATTYVSQVNEGQITTYPFSLNSTEFGGSMTTSLKVSETHEQYYQLNMNSDDIVVWYCLSNSDSSALTDNGYYASPSNDVVNSYYIYTKGNITYSGAGHSGSAVKDDEAKLFINTMVAAFRSVAQKATIRITDAADSNSELQYKYFALDYQNVNGVSTAGPLDSDIDEDDRTIYFRIVDPSLSGVTEAKTLTYWYAAVDKDNVPGERKPLMTANVEKINYMPGMTSGSLTLKLPDTGDDPLSLLSDENVAAVRLFIRIEGEGELSNEASVDLRKVGLFQLN